MEGYSVTEAASVLGVPTERVWELLARGVLSGAPEGETGMRVYLQPRPAPAPPEAKRPNGDGRRDEPELSPFRELLTEFRGLTERYGQALLALGEARGEVATLRSRVDLLEARMDLRLPSSAPSAAASWASTPMPFPAERAVVPTVPVAEEPSLAEEPEAEEQEPRSRTRGPRRATEIFAEALARAEDPSVPELPGAAETAAAMATLRAETDAALPRDLPSADAVPVAEEAETSVAAAPVEVPAPMAEVADAPAPVVPEQVSEPVAEELDVPAHAAPEEGSEETAVVAADRSSEAAEEIEADIDAADVVAEDDADIGAEEPTAETQDVEVAPIPAVETAPVSAAEPAPGPVATEPLEWDSDRYTTAIGEPDWFAAEVVENRDEEAAAPAVAHEPAGDPVAEHADAEDIEAEVADQLIEPAAETPAAETAPTQEPLDAAPSEEPDEETMLWFGRGAEDPGGASEMEVATTGTRSQAEPTGAGARALPGSSELDDALAALGLPATPDDRHPTEPAPAERAEREAPSAEGTGGDDWPPRSTFVDSSRAFTPNTPGTSTTPNSASRAYRRLRRIFPG